MSDTFKNELLALLEKHHVINGTEALALAASTVNCKHYVLVNMQDLEKSGLVTIIPSAGGRGNRTVYKLNRNSPGQRRRMRP